MDDRFLLNLHGAGDGDLFFLRFNGFQTKGFGNSEKLGYFSLYNGHGTSAWVGCLKAALVEYCIININFLYLSNYFLIAPGNGGAVIHKGFTGGPAGETV